MELLKKIIGVKNDRIIALDVCRGFLLLCMTFNHLMVFPFFGVTALNLWTMNAAYGNLGLLSNSEGFFFVAGITAGIVYGRLINQGRDSEVWARVWTRIKQMYLLYAALLLGVALFVSCNQNYFANWKALHNHILIWIDKPGIHYFLDNPFTAFGWGCAFIYLIPFFDIYTVYIVILGLIPWVLTQLKKGRITYVLAASLISYILAQYDSGITQRIAETFLPAKLAWFHLGAIQILFVSGLTLGFFHESGRKLNIHKIFACVCVLFVALLVLFYLTGAEIYSGHHLGIGRLGFFSLKAYGAYLCSRFLTFKPLAMLGKYSLQVFSYHIGLVYFMVYFFHEIAALSLPFQLACLAACLSTIWIPAYLLEKRSLRSSALSASLR
jgi:hypothetical protein